MKISFRLNLLLNGISLFGLISTIVLTFRQLPQTFFQQDEWLGLGQLMAIGWGNILNGNNILQLLFGDGRPLTRVWGTIFYEVFSLQPTPESIYILILHILNTILVYFIINRLIRNKFFAFLGAWYFAVADVAHQTVTWFGAAFGEQPSSLFIFLSILLFLFFIENKRKFYLYTSFLSAAISLYFKENGIFLFIFYFVAPFIFDKKYSIRKLITSYIPLFVFGGLFASYRLFEMILVRTPSEASVYVTSSSSFLIPTLVIRSVLYPLTSFSLSFIPYPIASFLSEWMWKLYYPYITQRPDLVFQTVVLDLIAVILSGFFLLGFYAIAQKKKYVKPITFSLTFFFLSILPYIVIAKTYAYLEPRYYYISLLANGILIGVIFSVINDFLKKRWKIVLLFFIILYAAFIRYNVSIIRTDIAYQVDIAKERKSFIKQLYAYLPTLTSNTNIFYFTGNKSWLVDNNFTPFQNGFGYTVMVLYYSSGKIPHYLPTTEYLWRLEDEGYKKIDGLGYGYYSKYDDLNAFIKSHPGDLSYVHAFYYDRDTKKLKNITQDIQAKLAQ